RSSMRKLHILLVVWLAALISPAVLISTGMFGPTHSLTGAIAGLWVVGYLVQFGFFMWIAGMVGKPKILWFFFASLAPWAIDWSLLASPLYAALWFPAAFAF